MRTILIVPVLVSVLSNSRMQINQEEEEEVADVMMNHSSTTGSNNSSGIGVVDAMIPVLTVLPVVLVQP